MKRSNDRLCVDVKTINPGDLEKYRYLWMYNYVVMNILLHQNKVRTETDKNRYIKKVVINQGTRNQKKKCITVTSMMSEGSQ